MDTQYFLHSRSYQGSESITSLFGPDDSIFISDKGTFITKGEIAKYSSLSIKDVLADLNGDLKNNIKPFVIFSKLFNDIDDSGDFEVKLPREMIHIDSHNWITHFIISTEGDQPKFNAKALNPIDSPHHIEMMSPESKDQFIDKVEFALKNIDNSTVEKIVIARKLNVLADIEIDKRLVINELLDSQPNSYIFSHNNFVGASPELLVEKFSETIRALPMAGTRKRHARVDEDDADIADLQTNNKDSFEHRVVIEDIVEKLNSIAKNVTASKNPHVVRLPHVAHLATSVQAISQNNTNLIDLVNCLHPTPAVAGIPTESALSLIAQIEGFDREIYGAPIGWMDSQGNGQCAIALRCAKIEGQRVQLYAGVGIVEGSVPEIEWNETQAKFGVMRDAMMNITQ